MNATILQNPEDKEATYREKAWKQNRGYVANVMEEAGEKGSIITDYQYDQNIHSDSQFMKEILETMPKQSFPVTLVTDGAYSGESNGQVVASFERCQCEGCRYKERCKPKMNKKTCRKVVSVRSKERARQQQFRETEMFQKLAAFRNGVETIPSILL